VGRIERGGGDGGEPFAPPTDVEGMPLGLQPLGAWLHALPTRQAPATRHTTGYWSSSLPDNTPPTSADFFRSTP
jgi:hypothetical protein